MKVWARFGAFLAVLYLVIILAGCAHEKAYKQGRDLLERKQYDRAISELTEAVRLAQEQKQYKAVQTYTIELTEAKKQGAQFHFLEARSNFDRGHLEKARYHVNKTLEYDPYRQDGRSLLETINARITRAQALRDQAITLGEQGQSDRAVEVIREAMGAWQYMPQVSAELERLERKAFDEHLQRARDFLMADDLDGAQREGQRAMEFRTGSEQAKGILRQVEERQRARQIVAGAQARTQSGDYEGALNDLLNAKRLHPTMANLEQLIFEAKKRVCDQRIQRGKLEVANGQYVFAMKYFRGSKTLLKDYGGIDGLMADTAQKLAAEHVARAQQYQVRQRWGAAMLEYLLTVYYDGTNVQAEQGMGLCRQQLQEQVRYSIGFGGFSGAMFPAGTAGAISAMAAEQLNQLRPMSVTVVDKSAVDWQRATSGDKGPVVDAVLVGQLLDNSVATDQTTRQGNSTYVDGTELVSNPDYSRVRRDVDWAYDRVRSARRRLEKDLEDDQRRRERMDRQARENGQPDGLKDWVESSDVRGARRRLQDRERDYRRTLHKLHTTPEFVAVPRKIQHSYPIYTVTKTAKISCLIKLVDANTGAVLFSQQVNADHQQSDRYIVGDDFRNVPNDPLSLPSDSVMTEKAMGRFRGNLWSAIDLAANEHVRRYAQAMRQGWAQNDIANAIENAFRCLYANPVQHSAAAGVLGFLEDQIGTENEWINLQILLQNRAQVMVGQK